MKHLALILTLCLCLSVPCSALTFFQADYDADAYTTETVCEGDWLPLRELSSILPYTVEWKDRTIYVYAERTWTIKPDRYLPEGVKIVDGVTYVTQRYMKHILANSFLYEGELYVLNGEPNTSKLVRGDAGFRERVLTVLYNLKLALPKDYKLIRGHLKGGIEQSEWKDGLPILTKAYTYPSFSRPVAYILAHEAKGADLAEMIAHEAYHVYLERRNKQDERKAWEYGQRVKAELLQTREQLNERR